MYTQDSSKCKSLGERQMKFPYIYNTGKRMMFCPSQNGTNTERRGETGMLSIDMEYIKQLNSNVEQCFSGENDFVLILQQYLAMFEDFLAITT